jgi:hypothetical protein
MVTSPRLSGDEVAPEEGELDDPIGGDAVVGGMKMATEATRQLKT